MGHQIYRVTAIIRWCGPMALTSIPRSCMTGLDMRRACGSRLGNTEHGIGKLMLLKATGSSGH